MDFAEIYSETREVEWLLANGKASIKVTLRAGSSDEVRAAEHKERSAKADAARKGSVLGPKEEDRFAVKRLAAFIEAWEWPEGSVFAGREPDNSDDFKEFVLGHTNPVAIEIAKRLMDEVTDIEGFMKASESN